MKERDEESLAHGSYRNTYNDERRVNRRRGRERRRDVASVGTETEEEWLTRYVLLFRGFIAAVGINEGPCFHGDRVAVQISFYYLPRGIYLATSGGQGAVPLVIVDRRVDGCARW